MLRLQHRKDVFLLFGGILLGFSLSVIFSSLVVVHWYYSHTIQNAEGFGPALGADKAGACLCSRTHLIDAAFSKPDAADDEADDEAFACDMLDIGKKLRYNLVKIQADMREQAAVRSSLLREITEHKQQLENLRRHVAQLEFRLRAVWLSVRVNEREQKRFSGAASAATSALSRLEDAYALQYNNSAAGIPVACDTKPKLLTQSASSAACATLKCLNATASSCWTFPWKMSFTVAMPKSCGGMAVLKERFEQHFDFYAETAADNACLVIAFICDKNSHLELARWSQKGRRIIPVMLNDENASKEPQHPAIVFRPTQTRFFNDILMPPFSSKMFAPSSIIPMLSPSRRRYTMSFEACLPDISSQSELNDFLLKLSTFGGTPGNRSNFLFNVKVNDTDNAAYYQSNELDFSMCAADEERRAVLNLSTFVLIPVFLPPTKSDQSVNLRFIPSCTLRLFEALRFGAVPVVLVDNDDAEYVRKVLPLGHFIDWPRAAVIVSWRQFFFSSSQLLNTLNYVLSEEEIFRLRLQGRRIYDTYTSSPQRYVDTMLAAIRQKLNFYPPAAPGTSPAASMVAYRDEGGNNIGNFTQLAFAWDEVVGPIEVPYASPQFQSNFSAAIMNSYGVWNDKFAPFHLYPYTPYDAVVPLAAETRFLPPSTLLMSHAQNRYFRPLGGMDNSDGAAAGAEMAHELGGDAPYEQYTIVMLTFRREQVLIESLQRLHQLPYLNKVIVVWNDVEATPPPEFSWPKLHVPLVVIKAAHNSLNNRFLPYNEIETEAVLSIDDDVFMRPDELTLAFRVWRENRDRLVGFPARYQTRHGNDWLYNSNYTCEYSMILTGVAFLHKYYLYRYAHAMPQSIRDAVDEWMNCEDIAMNFLIAHEMHKPALKVTSRWTFKCPNCGVESLWQDAEHFSERKKCLNLFTSIYGYNPLRVSQLRADSVLYKTRTPLGKEKCFKYV